MATKVCRDCGIERELEAFYRCKKGRFGRRGRCKCCEDMDYYIKPQRRESISKAGKKYRATEKGKEAVKRANEKHQGSK